MILHVTRILPKQLILLLKLLFMSGYVVPKEQTLCPPVPNFKTSSKVPLPPVSLEVQRFT